MKLSSSRRSPRAIASLALGVTALYLTTHADKWPQWRGPKRDGVSAETGLLQEWPKDGPKLRWKLGDLGNGYSTPAIVDDRVYIMSNEGMENEFVAALSVTDGKRIWTTKAGNVGDPNQQPSFPAARSTPTVDGDAIYALGSDGDLVCLERETGKTRWHKSLRADYGGKPGEWAYSESPLVDGDTVVCTPGGATATLVALNKKTGAVIWKCALPEADRANFSSAIVVDAGGKRQYVQMLEKGMVGVEAKTGRLLWRHSKATSRYGANIPTPVADGDYVYFGSAGTGGGAVKLGAKDGGVEAVPAYFDAKLPTTIGGSVKIGKYLYGTTGRAMQCIEFTTGQVKWEDQAIGAASLCYAGGRLYCHGEDGKMTLVEPSPEEYREKGRFTPPEAPKRSNEMEKAWAYPVVANGRLYIRDQNSLWCYDVK